MDYASRGAMNSGTQAYGPALFQNMMSMSCRWFLVLASEAITVGCTRVILPDKETANEDFAWGWCCHAVWSSAR